MAYSKNPERLIELLPYLRPLAERRAARWRLSPNGESKQTPAELWSYKVRQALYIAELHSLTYPELAYAYHNCVVEVIDSTTVQARFPEEPTHEVLPQKPVLASEVIKLWDDTHELVQDKLYLPLVNLSLLELDALATWADIHSPRLMLLLSNSGALTVALYDEDIAPFAVPVPPLSKES